MRRTARTPDWIAVLVLRFRCARVGLNLLGLVRRPRHWRWYWRNIRREF